MARRQTVARIALLSSLVALADIGAQQPGLDVRPTTAQSESRIALLIGNAAYEQDNVLRNPVNDVRALARQLRAVGFQVILIENASRRAMWDAIDDFSTRIRSGGVGLFYFSGHGIQSEGRNYLIPVDAQIKREVHVQSESIDADWIARGMEDARNRANLLILDACRNNPFAKSWKGSPARGLAQMSAAAGTLIAYATSPGEVASDGGPSDSNGPYAAALLDAIRIPGLPVEQMFKHVRESVMARTQRRQVPWESSSLVGELALNATAALPGPTTPPATTGSGTPPTKREPAEPTADRTPARDEVRSSQTLLDRFVDLTARADALNAYFGVWRQRVEQAGGIFRQEYDMRLRRIRLRLDVAKKAIDTQKQDFALEALGGVEEDVKFLERARSGS